LPRHKPLRGSPAYGQASAGIHALVIAATTAIAAVRTMISAIRRDGNFCRHQAPLDDRQAHPERQYERQEQSSDTMPRPALHRAPNMARLNGISKCLHARSLSSGREIRLQRSKIQGVDNGAVGHGTAVALRCHVVEDQR
jgi:hypothetical protein